MSQPIVQQESLLKQATIKQGEDAPEAQYDEPKSKNEKKKNNSQFPIPGPGYYEISKDISKSTKKISMTRVKRGKQLPYQYEEISKIYNKQSVPGVGAYELKQEQKSNKGAVFLRARRFVGEGFLA